MHFNQVEVIGDEEFKRMVEKGQEYDGLRQPLFKDEHGQFLPHDEQDRRYEQIRPRRK